MADFFNNTDAPEDDGKIHVGDQAYSQEELDDLIRLGSLSKEAEERYNTRLDKVWPKFNEATKENAELRQQLEELKSQSQPQATQNQVDQLQQALEEAERIGLMTNRNVDTRIYTALEGRELRNETYDIVDEASEMGIETTPDEILQYMKDEDIRDPWRAFNELYDPQIDRWQKQQLDGLKPSSLYTTENGQAGAVRQPAPVKVTDDNIAQLLRESLEID